MTAGHPHEARRNTLVHGRAGGDPPATTARAVTCGVAIGVMTVLLPAVIVWLPHATV
jgi:hypothetical protein